MRKTMLLVVLGLVAMVGLVSASISPPIPATKVAPVSIDIEPPNVTGNCVTVIYSDLTFQTARWNDVADLQNFKDIAVLTTWRKKGAGIDLAFRDDWFWTPTMGWQIISVRFTSEDKLQFRRTRDAPPGAHVIELGEGAGGSFASRTPLVDLRTHGAMENVFFFCRDEDSILQAISLYTDGVTDFGPCE